MLERLQKYLARAGVASRRHAEELIRQGEILVNGQVAELGCKIDPARDTVVWRGKRIVPKEENLYLMVNKPKGVVTTVKDPQGRITVLDLLPQFPVRVYPIGRLDMDTEGLLLLTNDGGFAYALTHPKFKVTKTYHALVQGCPATKQLEKMASGLMLEDGPTAPAQVSLLRQDKAGSWLAISIHEGRKRQVRRMCAAIGHPVLSLRRIAFGVLKLGDLPEGQWRYLTLAEVQELRRQAGI
ncbi:MAG TPA: rRNA pseudouridine synthase [Firmicutes bacterium]|nr:rRNA pseudouridine synthase [Bacillota bacterium]